jgi:hypothetical protein
LIADLDSDKFAVRQKAAKELRQIGGTAEPFIKKALEGPISLEARRRLEQILPSLADDLGPETVRTIRAIMVLERIGNTPAKRLLQELAGGAGGARETEEATASLERANFK